MDDDSPYRAIRLERDRDVARLTFDRPKQRNALTHAMMEEIADALRRVREDPTTRALILRGAGGVFCAGGDLRAMMDLPPVRRGEPDPLVAPYRAFGDTLSELNRLPQPVVAIVEGAAAGGGLGMACCADVVILHESARLGMPEPRAGFIPSQILPFVVRRIGEGPARELAVTGRMIDADEALRLGIGRYKCPDAAAIERTLDRVLRDVRRSEPAAVAAVKALVLACAIDRDPQVMDAAATSLVRLLRGAAAQAGMTAFLDKRPPPWAPDADIRAGGVADPGGRSEPP